MLEMAQQLMQDEKGESAIRNVEFQSLLPPTVSSQEMFDVVVSSYVLLDLPDASTRSVLCRRLNYDL